MSRYRNIFCAIWSDDKFPFLSDDAQLVWFHLYTNEFTNAVGIYKASVEGLAADKRWSLQRYRKGLTECCKNGLVEYDEKFHVVAFPKFFAWNKPPNPNVLSSWLPAWSAVPRCALKALQYQRLTEASKQWGEGFINVAERFDDTFQQTFGEPSPKQEQEQEQEQEQDKPNPPEPTVPPCPHEDIIAQYHETLPELQSVVISRWRGSARAKNLETAWKADKRHREPDFWKWFFLTVRTNPHWMGDNGRGWKADLGWLLKRENFDKVVERGVNNG